jgi:RNA polymerase sigma-54 factor
MKARLQTSLGQHLVLTPQLRQSLHLLQLSAHELEAELVEAVESNPLLDWAEPASVATEAGQEEREARDGDAREAEPAPEWERGEEWPAPAMRGGDNDADQDAAERVAASETLHDYLQWQLQLSQLSPRQLQIGIALVDAIDDDGYLRETPEAISTALAPDVVAGSDEVLAVLRQLQRLDPPGVGARDLGECLSLQLDALPATTPGRATATSPWIPTSSPIASSAAAAASGKSRSPTSPGPGSASTRATNACCSTPSAKMPATCAAACRKRAGC